jgi:hypothetical protein
VSPNEGRPGTDVSIKGEDFGTVRGAAAVSFNGSLGDVVSWNNESIQAKVPVGATDGDVRVINWASESSNGNNFNVGSYVTSVNPELARPGDKVSIYGRKLGDNAGEVRLGSDNVKIVSWSDREIVFEAPEKLGTGELVVSVGGEDCNPVRFRVARSVWYLAEGYTGGGFETYVLVQNPGDETRNVTMTFMEPGGRNTVRTYRIAPRSRYTVDVNEVLPDAEVSTRVTADGPVIVERAMYFNGRSGGTDSIGVR